MCVVVVVDDDLLKENLPHYFQYGALSPQYFLCLPKKFKFIKSGRQLCMTEILLTGLLNIKTQMYKG